MRIKFFQSSNKSPSLDDSSFVSSAEPSASQHTYSKRAVTEPRRGLSPYVQQISDQHSRPKTLSNVMQLFEENQPTKKKSQTFSNADPYRVKANGAVVMNRSNIDSDDMFGTLSNISSLISATSSSEMTSSAVAAANTSVSQQIAKLNYPAVEISPISSDLEGTVKTNDTLEKVRMASNSSRSTFPVHDNSRFSIESDSLCSMTSWTSSVVLNQPEDEDFFHEQQLHVTALGPPPRDTTKKWYNNRSPNNEEEDACEALTIQRLGIPHQDQLDYQYDDQQCNPHGNWKSMFELANQENIRLRQHFQMEQREHEIYMSRKAEALATARRENKYLRSALSRTQMLSNTNLQKENRRRLSTGEVSFVYQNEDEPLMTLSNRGFHGSSSMILSYERKIKILLDEIDAMQADEETLYIKQNRLASKNMILEQQLLARDESIRQLEHDLRICDIMKMENGGNKY